MELLAKQLGKAGASDDCATPADAPLLDMACRGCGARSVRLFLDLGEQPHCNRLVHPDHAPEADAVFPLRAGFCATCTLVQIDATVPKESMFTDYPYVSGTTRTLVDHFRETAARLTRTYGLGAGDLVVDIGSNDGTWLAQFKALGLTVVGVDPAENVVAQAVARGVPTLARFFNEAVASEIRAREGAARLITAAGVFFHLEELHSVIRGVKQLLSDDGVFVVQAIYLGGMIDNLAFDQIYHEHLVYYTLRSIEALFAQHGLSVIDARLVPIHGGSLEVHVVPTGRRGAANNVDAMRSAEVLKGYGDFTTYRGFAADVWALRDDLLAVLTRYRAAGKRVFAYGAPAKGATLLNSFGIGPELVEKACEKNAMKVGLLIPGIRIPIVDEKEARPDAYLMLAWNFLDEFVAKERAYLKAGGEFIVPVPSVRIVTGAAIV